MNDPADEITDGRIKVFPRPHLRVVHTEPAAPVVPPVVVDDRHEERVFALQIEVDIAHERLLLWRVAVVLLALAGLLLLRVALMPVEVPWR